MQQIIYKKQTPGVGEVEGVLRIKGKLLYFKLKRNPTILEVVNNLRDKGAYVQESAGWVLVDMFRNSPGTYFKLGNVEFDTAVVPETEIENILAGFYLEMFTKGGFTCKIQDHY